MTNDALHTLLPIAGWPEERARAVEITGNTDPILPTPFRIGETSTAALAAIGLAVADLWELRTGRRQEVAVETRQATASLRSGRYMHLDGAPVSTERNPVMGVYPAKNGRWSYLHCNFPNHRAAALRVLGVPEEREAVRQAVAQWDALELEEAIIAAKGAGGMVRTMAEWAQHPQAAAIASLPLMEIVKIGNSPPAVVGRPGARPDAGPRWADLCPYPRRARRRCLEDHRGAPAEYRLPGIRYWPRQALGPSGSTPAAGDRDPARAGP
jgi:crotonobetainyl-CoA:carnitine CoA-transferase CaiB-like acyl-CoA transferase